MGMGIWYIEGCRRVLARGRAHERGLASGTVIALPCASSQCATCATCAKRKIGVLMETYILRWTRLIRP